MKIVVRTPNWIGDVILALPAIESLKKNFPQAEIWLAASDWVKDLFASEDSPPKIIPLGRLTHWKTLRATVNKLKESEFDIGLLMTNSFASALLFYLAGIPERWGYRRDGRGLLLSKGILRKEPSEAVHHVHYYLGLLESLGLPTASPEIHLNLTGEEKDRARQELAALDVDLKKPLVILNPGAAYGPAKRWPSARFAELAGILQRRKNAEILITGSPDEATLAESVAAALPARPKNLAGKTSLRRLLGVISQSALFVTNDTGPMHMANALRVPVVAMFGPTDPKITGPLHQPSAILRKDVPCWPCFYKSCPYDHRCMTNISPEEAYQACAAFLG
jgi:heptosyltransferase-2